jgi:hypothetical protein
LSKNDPITNLVVAFFVGLILISKTGYSLGWDDSDYMRMIMCSVNSLNESNFQNWIHCQAGLYKAPVFLNLFVPTTLLFTTALEPLNLSDIDAIIILCTTLTVFCFILATKILKYLNNNLAKFTFVLLLFAFSQKFNYLFMTDLFLALLTSLITLKFISLYKLKNFGNELPVKQLALLSCLIVCALGTKFSAAPLIFFLLIIGLRYLPKSSQSMYTFKLISYSILPLLVFFFCLATIWRTTWNSSLSMFMGTQSEYYSSWFGHGLGKTLSQINEFYVIPILIIFSMIAIKSSMKNKREHYFELFLQLFPFVVGFVFYLISKTQDPRFLLPIILPIAIVILASFQEVERVNEVVSRNLKKRIGPTILSFLITFSSFSHYSNKNLDLGLPLLVYSKLETTGAVCPLTDSPSLNISKILLVDRLNQSRMELEARIINIPDLAMNGVSRDEALDILEDECKFLYADSGAVPNSYKNEYLSSYNSWLSQNATQTEFKGVLFYSRD